MKLNARRMVAFLLLIVLSVGFGIAFDAVATAIERHRYPKESAIDSILQDNSAEFGLPEPVLWAVIRTESGFVSNAVGEDGSIGLMQLTPTQFDLICVSILNEDAKDSGMLYDPKTNLRCGAALLSFLYQRYGVWETVYAAWHAGTDTVDAWLADPLLVTPQGTLLIPDPDTATYAETVAKAVKMYSQLYYEA